ncbi:hypothetical protein CC80DRAFT_490533 [Byssothecium circinans]|uniref:AA1-like domain-containing protein n=1 Tax=Byssothecium circinans TaxID=147558 RepID=A0A6A5U242_9PLEO|nr:hypothetical protein CC80DRAFT_490533 [Byssothecium circinans]
MHLLSSLVTLLPLTLALPSLTPRAYSDPCDYTTNPPTFYLTSAKYSSQLTYSTPAHLAVSSATVEFNLTNSVDDSVNERCIGYASGQQFDAGFFAYPYAINCTGTGGGGVIQSASFEYTGYARTVGVNETWTCGGNTYLGTAGTKFDFQCKEDVYQNPNWTTPGEIYSSRTVTCEPLNTSVVPTVIQAV